MLGSRNNSETPLSCGSGRARLDSNNGIFQVVEAVLIRVVQLQGYSWERYQIFLTDVVLFQLVTGLANRNVQAGQIHTLDADYQARSVVYRARK